MLSFNCFSDIDQKILIQETNEEVDRVDWNGRTREKVFSDCAQGRAAEIFLKQHFGYINNPKKWQDLISPLGLEIEIKTTKKSTNIPRIVVKCSNDRNGGYLKSNYLFIFLVDSKSYHYDLIHTYEWNYDLGQFVQMEKWDFANDLKVKRSFEDDTEFLANY